LGCKIQNFLGGKKYDGDKIRLGIVQMGDHGFVLICSGIPGDRDALYFLQERKPIFFPF
jgi:hypothetical protein